MTESRKIPVSQFRRASLSQYKGKGDSLNNFQQSASITEQETRPIPTLHPQANLAQLTYRSIAEEETLQLPAIPAHTNPAGKSAKSAPGLLGTILSRAREPKPERWAHTWQQVAETPQARVLGQFPMLLVTDALGIVIVTFARMYSLRTLSDQQIFLWLGFLLVFAASFLRMLSPIASRVERILILCCVGLFVYIVPAILSPLHFIFVDEYLHWRTASDIMRTEHLFTANSQLPISPLYPGLEIVTNAFSSLSGQDILVSGLVVVGIARIVLVLSIFMLFEQITKSVRTAGIATMLYMSNSGFFMFDSLFLYESLGLAIGTFLLFIVARTDTAKSGRHRLLLMGCLATGGLTMVHHVSDFFFIGLLILWTIISKLLRQPLIKLPVTKITFCGLLLAALWVGFIAKPVVGYLSAPIIGSLDQLKGILLGTHIARSPSIDHTGTHPTALWQQLVMLMALVLATLGIPFAALCLWHRYRHKALPFALGLVSLLYPVVQALRMTSESANIADRSAPFIFIGVSFALAVFITQMWPTNKLRQKQALLITTLASVVFLGGSMLGAGPTWRLMPGSYLVGDDARSIDPESVQMAIWTLSHLGPDNRVFGSRTDSLLLNSYGGQHIVSIPADRVDIAPVYYATEYHVWEGSILQAAHVRYLIVDLRLSTAMPTKGYYFEGNQEPDKNITTPISVQALKKFDTIGGVKRILDSGNIVIYDVGGLINAQKKP